MKKTAFILLALFVALAFLLAPFHHHEDGIHHEDCTLCRLSHEIFSFFLLFFSFLFFVPFRRGEFLHVSRLNFHSLLSSLSLHGRAPPFGF